MSRIGPEKVQNMVSHWLGCPPNGYFGSLYGSDIRAMLQAPQRSGLGNDFVAKMRRDIPILTVIPDGQIDIGITDSGPDRRDIVIGIGSQFVVQSQGRALNPVRPFRGTQRTDITVFRNYRQTLLTPSDSALLSPAPYGGLYFPFGGKVALADRFGRVAVLRFVPQTWFFGLIPARLMATGTDAGLVVYGLTMVSLAGLRPDSGNTVIDVQPSNSASFTTPATGGLYVVSSGDISYRSPGGGTELLVSQSDAWIARNAVGVNSTGTTATLLAFVQT